MAVANATPWGKPSGHAILAVSPRNIPVELRSIPRWVVWRGEKKDGGKLAKPPYQARNPRHPASTKNPDHLADMIRKRRTREIVFEGIL